jgi:hypothetical protein
VAPLGVVEQRLIAQDRAGSAARGRIGSLDRELKPPSNLPASQDG